MIRQVFPAAFGLLCSGYVGPALAAVADSDFVEEVYLATSGQSGTTGIAWAPDGSDRLFVMRQTGQIRIVENGVFKTPAFALVRPLHSGSECGVIGMAFDPGYIQNRFVYFFVSVSTTEHQIIRYTDQDSVGVDKTIIIAGLPSRGRNHDGGALGFGPDGKLYFAIGDLGNGTGATDDLTSVAAKVSRVNLDGSAPADNPFFDGDGPNDDRIWARGFRNPFTFAFQPSSEKLWVNVTGAGHEQVFVVSAGDHAGWGTYQNDQPEGYLPPVIAYRTGDTAVREILPDGATRKAGVSTFRFAQPYHFRLGSKVTISGADDASYDGAGYVVAQTADSVSIQQDGPDGASGGGTITALAIGYAITGGTFWDSSGIPEGYRGNFLFGDYGSGNVARATIDSTNTITSLDNWITAPARRAIDLAVGPDGNLYYALFDGGIVRVRYLAKQQGLVVSQLHLRVHEGAEGAFGVRLAAAPSEDVIVQLGRTTGDRGITPSPDRLTFSPDNWSVPQVVFVAAEQDEDALPDEATIGVSSEGIPNEAVTVRVSDDDPYQLAALPAELEVVEGESVTFRISLTGPPSLPVTVSLTADGDVELDRSSAQLSSDDWESGFEVTLSASTDEDLELDSAEVLVQTAGSELLVVPVAVREADPVTGDAGAAGWRSAEAGASGSPGSTNGGDGGVASDAGAPSNVAGQQPSDRAQPDDDSDCGCRVAGESGSSATIWLLTVLLGARRRRRAKRLE